MSETRWDSEEDDCTSCGGSLSRRELLERGRNVVAFECRQCASGAPVPEYVEWNPRDGADDWSPYTLTPKKEK